MDKYEQYIESQGVLILLSLKKFRANNFEFKSLTQYKQHCRLLKRWCFLFGSRSMDDTQGKHFSKNRLRRMKNELR